MGTDQFSSHLIESTDEFNKCCKSWGSQQYLAIDTEFIRQNTFYPKPGLIQLADSQAVYLVDPLRIDDWSGFTELLQSPSVMWVLHSGSEDLFLLLSFLRTLPRRLFDTQVAAAYAGLGFSLGYQALVQKLLEVEIPKGETRSDWLQRPLSSSQLHYAASDVRYLLPIRKLLKDSFGPSPKMDWLFEDMTALLKTVADTEDPACWQKQYCVIPGAWRLSERGLVLLQALCVWREGRARERNRPRLWIAKDMELFAIASRFEASRRINHKAFYAMDEISDGMKRNHSRSLLRALETPTAASRVTRVKRKSTLLPKYRGILKSWRSIVQSRAKELEIAPEVLARTRWLESLLGGYDHTSQLAWSPPMAGWRRQILENDFECSLKKTADPN